MAEQVRLAFARGGSISVEVAGTGGMAGGRDTSRGLGDDAAARVTQTFDEALRGLHQVADSLQSALLASVTPPDSVTVQFGVDFSASAGLVIKGSGGASLNITMQWKKA